VRFTGCRGECHGAWPRGWSRHSV